MGNSIYGVIPAQAGIQNVDSRLRGNDTLSSYNLFA